MNKLLQQRLLQILRFGVLFHAITSSDGNLSPSALDVIKIDCGCEPGAITPGYMSDASFIDTGKNMHIQTQYYYNGLDPAFKTIRSFPDGERNCYTLNPSGGSNDSYLIQLRFMYGNYDQQNHIPIFDVYIGVDYLGNVNAYSSNVEFFIETIYKPKTDFIYICLVNIGQGTPFISELILMPLNSSTIYDSNLGALRTINRCHSLYYSASSNGLYYDRYSDDPYGRFWAPLPQSFKENWNKTSAGKEFTNVKNDEYEIPASILKSRVEPVSGMNSLVLNHTPENPTDIYYFYLHFIESEKLDEGELREFMIYMNGNVTLGPFIPTYMEALTVVSPPLTLGPGDSKFWFSINQTKESTLLPILNAFECMVVVNVSQVATNQNDVKAIMDVKRSYPYITGWQADPCLPRFPWNGLICSSNNTEPPTITSLNLSSKALTGEILPSLVGLTSLIDLDLSHNALRGSIPEFLAEMPSLKIINLKGNNFSGSVPSALLDEVKNNLLSLSVDDNPYLCTSNLCAETKSKNHHILAPLVASSAALIIVLIVAAVFYSRRWRKRGSFALSTRQGRMTLKNKQFTYSEVICMTNNFERVLGKGAYGTVYYGSLEEKTEVAVKLLNKPSALISFQTEAELLMRVHHRNLVSLIGYCNEGETMALIYEYMVNGNLQEHLSENKQYSLTLSLKDRIQIAIDAAQGLDYLHNGSKPAIVHRDMKTANILLDGELEARIADFGVSKIFTTESASHISTEHIIGTPGYVDPEYNATYRLNEKSDVYSFGVILLELLTGRPPIITDATKSIHISKWVMPLLQQREIWNIVDQRLGTDFNINSAWKFLEIAMSCVPNVGIQRPTMPQVLAELKECLALELVHENAKNGADVQTPFFSTHNTFDAIQVDNKAYMGPRAT